LLKPGGRKIILKACIKGGVRVSESTVKRITREAKSQEARRKNLKSISWILGRSKEWITVHYEKENVAGRAN
jgi:hypothetical protein